MRSRDEVLTVDTINDRNRELESQLVSNAYTLPVAASEPVAWAMRDIDGQYHRLFWTASAANTEQQTSGHTPVPLYPHPSAAAVRVTDAMVEAAARAFYGAFYDGDRLWVRCPDDIRVWWMDAGRDALTAALTHATTPTRGRDE